jgi:CheY-like chemotaxis protein
MHHDAVAGLRRGARILVVDDHADTVVSLAKLLEILGHEVRTARDGPGAVAAALDWRPEYILLDLGLPAIDGYQVAARLKQDPSCRASVIIAVTGYGQVEDRQRSRAAGIDYHMLKPVDHRDLLALLMRSEIRPPGDWDRQSVQERSADTAGMAERERDQEASDRKWPDPPTSSGLVSDRSRVGRPGGEAAVRSVASRLTGEGEDR